MNVMPIPELIEKVSAILQAQSRYPPGSFWFLCHRNRPPTSDIDFVVYGCSDILKLEKDLESIDTFL